MDTKEERDQVVLEGMRYALENQIRWQHYAEAKNLGLLTISGATMGLLLSPLQNVTAGTDVSSFLVNLLVSASYAWLILFSGSFIAFVTALTSYYVPFKRKDLSLSDTNFISWRYINSRSADGAALRTELDKYGRNAQIQDALNQQILGSRLTQLKYRFFNFGFVAYVSGIVLFALVSLGAHFGLI